MITKSVAFALFRKWLNGRKTLRADIIFAHARISVICTVALISGDTLCLRLAESGFIEVMLTAPFHFEFVQPKSPQSSLASESVGHAFIQNNRYEAAVIAFHGEDTVTFMQLDDSHSSPPK